MTAILAALVAVLCAATLANTLGLLALARRVAAAGNSPQPPRRQPLPPAGHRVGQFRAELLDGTHWATADLTGRRVTVMFALTNCEPCQEMLEELRQRAERLPGPAYLLVAGGDLGYARQLAATLPQSARIAMISARGEVAKAFAVTGFPAVLEIDDTVVKRSGPRLSALEPAAAVARQ